MIGVHRMDGGPLAVGGGPERSGESDPDPELPQVEVAQIGVPPPVRAELRPSVRSSGLRAPGSPGPANRGNHAVAFALRREEPQECR